VLPGFLQLLTLVGGADTQCYKGARLTGQYPYGCWVYVKSRKDENDYGGDTQFAANQVYTDLSALR
jgi:hypothetical protein